MNTIEQFREALPKYTMYFKFKKIDGSIREALGTTNLGNVPKAEHPKGVKGAAPSVITFFDFQAYERKDVQGPWRSMKKDINPNVDIIYVFR